MKVASIILARGGSKGVPNKNKRDFCGKPLISWTIEQCIDGGIDKDNIFVSSDSHDILEIGHEYGVGSILRTPEVSGDGATSELSWIYSINYLRKLGFNYDWIFAPQVTSPMREPSDIKNGLLMAESGEYDSLFAATKTDQCSLWKRSKDGLESIGYDYKNRKRRQDNDIQYIENGSFYMFKPDSIKKFNNRMYGNIGIVEMDQWKSFEIDSIDDFKLSSLVMKEYMLKK
jgi:N-acylneuraminate cytidylyltransferase